MGQVFFVSKLGQNHFVIAINFETFSATSAQALLFRGLVKSPAMTEFHIPISLSEFFWVIAAIISTFFASNVLFPIFCVWVGGGVEEVEREGREEVKETNNNNKLD